MNDHGGCLPHVENTSLTTKSSAKGGKRNVKRESSRTRGLASERKIQSLLSVWCRLLASSSHRYRFLFSPIEVTGSNLLSRSVSELDRLAKSKLGNTIEIHCNLCKSKCINFDIKPLPNC